MRQEKRKSQENDESGRRRTGVEKQVGIRALSAHSQERGNERLTTNCDSDRVNRKCDTIENNSDQDSSQSLLKIQRDDDIKAEEGEEDSEARQVVEDQLSLEEWGEDDLQVGKIGLLLIFTFC